MKNKLIKSVCFGWILSIGGILWPIATYINPELAPEFMWEHIFEIYFLSILLLVLRYSMYGPILDSAKNAAKITMFALTLQFLTTGRLTDRMNPLMIGLVIGCLMIMAFQIMYLVFVCWYYLIKETIALKKIFKEPHGAF